VAFEETSLGGPARSFPTTRWSLILQARDPSSPTYQASINDLCRMYWKPVYASLRALRQFSNEEAKDLTQGFFIELLEGGMLDRFQADRGSFRRYLRGALRQFMLDRRDAAMAIKRGGGKNILSLDAKDFENVTPARGTTAEEVFDRQWAKEVLDRAVEDLREEMTESGKELHFRLFERYELHEPEVEGTTYARMAQEFGIKETDVTNHLFSCRSRLRELILTRIRDYADTESDVRAELAEIFTLLTGEKAPYGHA